MTCCSDNYSHLVTNIRNKDGMEVIPMDMDNDELVDKFNNKYTYRNQILHVVLKYTNVCAVV